MFDVGSLVMHIAGGPQMAVVARRGKEGDYSFDVQWYYAGDGTFHEDTFRQYCLRECPDEKAWFDEQARQEAFLSQQG